MDDSQLYKDSGQILEHQKQYAEAAAMYIKGDQYERAADMYIKYLIKGDKNKITEAAAIMEKVENDQLNSSFAKACVSCGRYQEAVRAYERANDIDKVSLFFLLLHISLTVYVIHDFPLSFSVLYPFILCPYIYLSVFFLSFSLSLSPPSSHTNTHTLSYIPLSHSLFLYLYLFLSPPLSLSLSVPLSLSLSLSHTHTHTLTYFFSLSLFLHTRL